MTLGIINQKRTQIITSMVEALRNEDDKQYQQAIIDLAGDIEENVMQQARELADVNDIQVLAQRGIRQLTSKEKEYYEKLTEAFRSKNPKQALADTNLIMPETIVDSVMEDLETEHELLSAINFENTGFSVKWLVNTNGYQKAKWGEIDDEIVKEVTSGFKQMNMSQMKLSAFIPVPKSILDLGPSYLDNYVRKILIESLANGLEYGLVNNLNTAEGPIAMIADLSKGTANTDTESVTYAKKTAIKVKDFQPKTVGNLLSKLAKDEKGNSRIVKDVIMIVNPTDYLTKVFPATTVMGGDGTYRKDVMPFPMKIIQSAAVTEGEAVLGLAYRYFAGAGMTKDGKIEYSDDYQFLEDNRVYLIKLYANGKPLDNNSFIVLDISKLEPMTVRVMTVPETQDSTTA